MTELEDICYKMSYGDDSRNTFYRYLQLLGLQLSEEEKESEYKQYLESFDD
jgi:hypothetical protein